MTTSQWLQAVLIEGLHVNKFDMLDNVGSVALAQRVNELRHDLLWDVKSARIKGKGSLVEYWLEPDEIARIKRELKWDSLNSKEA